MAKRIDVKEICENCKYSYEIQKIYFQNINFGKNKLSEEEEILKKYSKYKVGNKLSKEDILQLSTILGFEINYVR